MNFFKGVFLILIFSSTLFGESIEIQCTELDAIMFEHKKKLCETKKDVNACDSLANYYRLGLCTQENKPKAISFRKYACEQGISKACYDLSFELDNDEEQKYEDATRALERACKLNKEYCVSLGLRYVVGNKIKQNYFKGKEIFEKGCNGNEGYSCYLLGTMYQHGYGVRQDYKKAKQLYGKACDLENNDGCENYSRLNKNGY